MKKFNYLFWTFLIVLFSLSVSAQNYALSFYPGTGSGINKNTFTVYGIDVSSNTKLTVEAWCNLEALLPGNSTIVIKENTDCMSSADIAYWMYINSTGYLVFHLGNGTSFTQVTTTNPIPLDEWHHLSGTWDGSTIRVYIDGIEEATGSLSGSLDVVNDAGEMNIGNRWYCYRQPYDGIIDELRIWDVDRSEQEILDNMHRELPNPSLETNLIAYYKFNQGSGTTAYDSGPNGYDGQLGGVYYECCGTSTAPEWVTSTVPLFNCPVVDLGDDQMVYYGYNPMACATLTADVYDGTPPYTYLWSNGETTESIDVCPEVSTIYSVTVTDANQCSATDDVLVDVMDVRCGWMNNKVLVCHTSFWNPNIQYTICVRKWVVPWLLYFGDQIGSCDWYKNSTVLDEMPEFESVEEIKLFDQEFYEENFKSDDLISTIQTAINIYPNPTAGIAKIDFEVSDQGQTTVELINIQGQIVKQLYNKVTEPGTKYSVELNAFDLDKGIYFLRLINGSEIIQEKISIIR